MRRKKRTFILFEILIALSLTAVLLTFLFSFFAESAKIENKLDRARMAITARGHLQTRLQSLLSSISPPSFESPLYTEAFEKENSLSLVAIFDNGVDPDPAFSGPILGRLFLDEQSNLSLATWPLDKEHKHLWRKEILLPCVESFEFEFLGKNRAPEHGKKEKIEPINAAYAWHSHWSKSETRVPTIVRLNVQEEKAKEPLRFAFVLPRPDDLITYSEAKL